MSETPLTHAQRIFAAENHGLIYQFLNKNHLSEDDYYDIIALAYLKAVRDYFSTPSLQVYSFSTICWKIMSCGLSNYLKSQKRQKRDAEILSIHAKPHEDAPPLEDSLIAYDDLMVQLETELLFHDLASRISKQQLDMVRMKTDGYGIRDIARSQKTTMKRVRELLGEVHDVLTEICYG